MRGGQMGFEACTFWLKYDNSGNVRLEIASTKIKYTDQEIKPSINNVIHLQTQPFINY